MAGGLVGLGTGVGATHTYRFWTGPELLSLDDTDIGIGVAESK